MQNSASIQLAQTPPMGWNSFDCYGSSVTEAEVRANADYMADCLASYGWGYIVIDFCWSHPAPGAVSNPNLENHFNELWPMLHMDDFGRLLPAPERFPSAKDGLGFKPLADYIHDRGLKFGIHIMRGIPRQAASRKLPIKGTTSNADQIADPQKTCNWLNHMYGIDMTKEGAQTYYNSIFELYADWGVDYVKVDDMVYPYHGAEIEAIWSAAQTCGRPIVVSLSCGPAFTENASHLSSYAHLWRISADFWDDWELLKKQFDLCHQWARYSGPGHWADADMLPIGRISLRGPKGTARSTRFTQDEQMTLMTLLAIVRSPLMVGANLPDNDEFTHWLLTNPEVIAVNQHSTDSQHLFTVDGIVAWVSQVPNAVDKYLALFNLSDDLFKPVTINLRDLGFQTGCNVRDLWQRAWIGKYREALTITLKAHSAGLYRLTPED